MQWLDLLDPCVAWKCGLVCGTKLDGTSFELISTRTLPNTFLLLTIQLKKYIHEIVFGYTCMNQSKVMGRKMNQMVCWIIY
jgi:hypothetical protein